MKRSHVPYMFQNIVHPEDISDVLSLAIPIIQGLKNGGLPFAETSARVRVSIREGTPLYTKHCVRMHIALGFNGEIWGAMQFSEQKCIEQKAQCIELFC